MSQFEEASLLTVKVIFGNDVTVENIASRLDALIGRLDEIIYAEDCDRYPSTYLEIVLRLRLHLSILKFETLPSLGDSLFSEAIGWMEEKTLERLFNKWINFFAAKELPYHEDKTPDPNTILVEINLNASEADVIAEIKKIVKSAWEQCPKGILSFKKDSSGRHITFPFRSALSALENYEDMMISGAKTPTAAAKATNRITVDDGLDSHIRSVIRQVNEKLHVYLFWGELECDPPPSKNSLQMLSANEIKALENKIIRKKIIRKKTDI